MQITSSPYYTIEKLDCKQFPEGKMKHYQFFQNRECEYFPCHAGVGEDCFNCLFCYCPLYALGDRCGGNFSYTEKGIKDCSNCVRPHIPKNYADILAHMDQIMEYGKKRSSPEEIT